MLKKYLQKRKIKQAWDEAIAENAHRDHLVEKKKEVEDATIKMTSSPCAINDMSNCRKDCVHFGEGSVWTIKFEGYLYVDHDYPRCKLWA